MGNMSYCRFENTVEDLKDCINHLEDKNISSDEKRSREKLFELCAEVVSMDPEDRG